MRPLSSTARPDLAAGGALTREPDQFEGFVLAGGESRRMGRDKASIELEGRPLIAASLDALAGASMVTVVGGKDRSLDLGVPCIPDAVSGRGPLVGLLTALEHAHRDSLVVLSCDLPAVSRRAVTNLLDALGDADAVVPVIGGRMQWVASAWRRRAHGRMAAAHGRGARSVHEAVSDLRVCYLLDTDDAYVDVDTPAELEAVFDGSVAAESP